MATQLINRKHFYDTVKTNGLFPALKQSQLNGIEAIFNKWDGNAQYTDLRWLAYMLATTYHETARTMQPVEEYGHGAGRTYGKKFRMNGKPYITPDKIYYGRGNVQLSWIDNYEKMGHILGIDLVNHPELALQVDVAVSIMFEGMTKGDSSFGDFTGKCLEQYFNATTNDPVNARRIINGLDKADAIAGYHNKLLAGLSYS